MEDHTVTSNGVDLHYRSIGEGPVLFLVPPGRGVASNYLQRGFSSLAKNQRLVFIDTRGSGLSVGRRILSEWEQVDMADDLEALRVQSQGIF
jgi:pimeloyl-ACP methyl ester carboxylesterase